MPRSAVDDDVAAWAKDSGYGDVISTKSTGSSGWASFRRVQVSDPPTPDTSFFVKTSNRSAKAMFEGEALGLRALYECSRYVHGNENEKEEGVRSLRVPEVFHWADLLSSKGSFLVMEYLNLGGRGDQRALGVAMGRLHVAPPTAEAGNPDGRFGFDVDNTIGGTPQPNPWTRPKSGTDDWIAFFRDHRIGHQLALAGDSRLTALWENDVAPRLVALFEGVDVRPSILHGDLWSGNIGSADGGAPSIFDPAVYWGHHEAEWGMSWCAGFSPQFWEGYRSVIPEDPGFQDRKPLYDAYHQLNHYNLFGGGYLNSSWGDLERVKNVLDKKGA